MIAQHYIIYNDSLMLFDMTPAASFGAHNFGSDSFEFTSQASDLHKPNHNYRASTSYIREYI